MATSSPTRDYDGTGDYLATGDTTTYNFTTGDFTVLCWIYTDSTTGAPDIVTNGGSASNNGWALRSQSTLNLAKYGTTDANSALAISTGAWIGVGAACNNGTDVNFIKIASGVISTENKANAFNVVSSTSQLRIGQKGVTGANDYNGAVNHVQIFNRQLTTTEMSVALNSPGSVTNGLLGYWPGYGQLSPEPDLSVTGSDGTVTGTGGVRYEACPAAPQQMPIM